MSRSDRRGTATHEAAHVVVGRALGARGLKAWLTNDRSGEFTGDFDGSKEDEAVILLAGRAAAGSRHGGASDLREARKLLRASDMSESEARRRAEQLVSQNRGAINRAAARLDRDGRI